MRLTGDHPEDVARANRTRGDALAVRPETVTPPSALWRSETDGAAAEAAVAGDSMPRTAVPATRASTVSATPRARCRPIPILPDRGEPHAPLHGSVSDKPDEKN